MNGYVTRTYWVNQLYPHNPSMDEELNRLLGWTNFGHTMTTCNEFTRNGTDSEYCPDDSQETITHGNNRAFSSPSESQFQPQLMTRRNVVPINPEPHHQPGSFSSQVSSSIFMTANRARRNKNKKLHCSFCKNNGERELVFASHNLKTDAGIIICPVLRNYTCPICKANGDRAHTIKYCPIRERN